MKLYFSPTSPYVRKCLVTADELGLIDQISFLPSSAHPVHRDASIVAHNPLGKVPTLLTEDGQSLYDSRVICEYLNDLGGGSLLPANVALRWEAQSLQSLGDGILDAALLIRYEQTARPEALRWNDWIAAKAEAVHCSLSHLEAGIAYFEREFHLGLLTLGCALWYLDLRFSDWRWRERYPKLAQASEPVLNRASMQKSWSIDS
ncbi:MAG: glutathione S-transferase [Betaproteobacteria bacterium]|nr:glutathione S-transferase [Betaproteobacteria bacterium]NCW19215.1 glutathione S-transferase [Betaproteobacteria bacterium]NCX87870.1 glutathione S-transferase [Betaproteobacteria bacterium]NDG18197.1 glutathione S-transferase [Betaproteobacteria bacterium]